MNSTDNHRPNYSIFLKLAIAYIAGIGTYQLFQHQKISGQMDGISSQISMLASSAPDTVTGHECACDTTRYGVSPRVDSRNVPIPSIPTCSTMVHNAVPKGVTPVGMGAWFSKVTLDIMFCNKPDANGIYVYKAVTTEGQPTYVIEAAKTYMILSTDDGSSYIYYSRTMCPTACGVCGM